MKLPGVAAVAVIGLPDAERGELVCAVVEPPASGPPITFGQMRAACLAAGLMPQKVPERLELMGALPRNPTLKVRKADLVQRYGGPTAARRPTA